VVRGAYQFFRSNQDPVAQADKVVDAVGGALAPGDLPPVIDVESKDGQSASTIRNKVQQWIDRIEERLGVTPIVYTGPYFWRDTVAGADFDEHPLWIAHYGTSCPMVPPTWSNLSGVQWMFHQHTSSGRVQGISGDVDMNRFNGTMSQLLALTVGGDTPPPPPPGDGCLPVGDSRIIDNGDACFTAGGDPSFLRSVSTRGFEGDLIWTGTTSLSSAVNFAQWDIAVEVPGTYEVEVWIDDVHGTSRQARYAIAHEGGQTAAIIDQNGSTGWVSLGAYAFGGAGEHLRLDDNTGERGGLGRHLVFDAARVTRLDDTVPGEDPCARVEVYGTGSWLNVRPQASTTGAAVGRLDDGDIATRLETVTGQAISGNSTWYRVNAGGVTGYITAVYARCRA
jgi:hypothetical protein